MAQTKNQKILIIRFSSFGDVLQSLSIPAKLKLKFPEAEIHWVTRSDFQPLLASHPALSKIWPLKKQKTFLQNILALFSLSSVLAKEDFFLIYDAHNNLRSHLIAFFIRSIGFFKNPFHKKTLLIRKSQKRWKRFLLFRFRINTFQMPFSGQRDLLQPLEKIGITSSLPQAPQFFFPQGFKISTPLPAEFIALAPSAAHDLKKWPQEYWEELIAKNRQKKFILLGGPEDLFLQNIASKNTENVLNFAGKLSFLESAFVILRSKLLICNDTGLMHIGEQLGHPTIALMGPAPFGFPSRPTTKVLELELACRPCSKHGQGPCINKNFQQCLRGISPLQLQNLMDQVL